MGAPKARHARRATSTSGWIFAIVVTVAVTSVVGIQAGIAVSRTHRVPGGAGTLHGSVSPAYGRVRGGTTVTITGTGFEGVTAVRFGPRAARFSVKDDTTMTAVSPRGSGTVMIRVTSPGSSPGTSAQGRFTYLATPTVRAVAPSSGPATGGTTVVVRGTGFAPGSRLMVGATPARAVRVRNPHALVAVMPAGFGSLALRVTTPGGTSTATATARFGYRSKVLVIGDSLGIDLGWGFGDQLPGASLLSVTDDAVGSSGLVRWDFYDWPTKLREDLRATRPQFVVVLFGANDQQEIATPGGAAAVGTKAWDRAYATRAKELASIATSFGAKVCWMGLPRMGPHAVVASSFVDEVNRVLAAALPSVPGAGFAPTTSLFTTGSGQYTPMVRLPSGALVVGRQPDEVHLTPGGATAIDALALTLLGRLGTTRAR